MSPMSPIGIPMVVLPLTFLFVLLIILITKAPKAGICIVGGLVFLAPVLAWAGLRAGVLAGPRAVPLTVVPATFLFVLLLVVLGKSPKAGVGLIVAILVMAVLAFLVGLPVTRHAVHREVQIARPETGGLRQDRTQSSGSRELILPGVPQPRPSSPSVASPIWSEGIEQELEADVYPSILTAATALGRRMTGPIRTVVGDSQGQVAIILFQEGNERSLVAGFGRALENELPGATCLIEADLRNIDPGEVGVTLRVDEKRTVGSSQVKQHVSVVHRSYVVNKHAGEDGSEEYQGTPLISQAASGFVDSGRIVAAAFTEDKRASTDARFVRKPWVDEFATMANIQPDQHFVVARSREACTSENDANRQALEDARLQLAQALGTRGKTRFARLPAPTITTVDVLQGGFIADRFVQSFDGSAGRIWRQALLIDVSGPKLEQLAVQKVHEAQAMAMSWGRMGLSVIGALVLIGVIYFFLNMATRGYYEWSLRIAGVVLAIVAIVSILMIVH